MGSQGSSLSLFLPNAYITPLIELVRSCGFSAFFYANDTQIVVSVTAEPEKVAKDFKTSMSSIANWMQKNFLKLDAEKTVSAIL